MSKNHYIIVEGGPERLRGRFTLTVLTKTMKNFHSIRDKFIGFTQLLILAIIALFLVLTSGLLFTSMQKSFSDISTSIRNSLVSKGWTLAVNNSNALRGMAGDNEFMAVRDLVVATVKQDKDVSYGIYMDDQRRPWVVADSSTPDSAFARSSAPLNDSISVWAGSVEKPGYRRISKRSTEILEFAAPVMDGEKRLGTIRYGLTAYSMKEALSLARHGFVIRICIFLGLVLLLSALTFFFSTRAAHRRARSITHPLDELTKAVNTIAQGDYSSPVAISTDDETGLLSRNFEAMRSTIKQYTENLEKMVAERTSQLEAAQKELVDRAHQAGMADIASGALHNIGNILNSVKTSIEVMGEIMDRLPLKGLESANRLLMDNMAAVDDFILHDPKGKKLLAYYAKLDEPFRAGALQLRENLGNLREKTEVIAEVVAAQQNYAGMGGLSEDADIADIVENALAIQSASNERHGIIVERQYRELPKIKVQKVKLMNTLVNLIKNAKDAMAGLPADQKKLTVTVARDRGAAVIRVNDTGCGIPKENLTLIFSHGFTTKKDGHGFGLHSCANYMKEMGGELLAESDGQGKGATFSVRFPIAETAANSATERVFA